MSHATHVSTAGQMLLHASDRLTSVVVVVVPVVLVVVGLSTTKCWCRRRRHSNMSVLFDCRGHSHLNFQEKVDKGSAPTSCVDVVLVVEHTCILK